MKAYNLIINEEAKVEISDSYAWYEEQQNNLGERFLDVLDKCFSLILSNPKLFPVKHKNMRQALLKDFPFAVIYEIENHDIVVFAVFHTSRKPDSWKNET